MEPNVHILFALVIAAIFGFSHPTRIIYNPDFAMNISNDILSMATPLRFMVMFLESRPGIDYEMTEDVFGCIDRLKERNLTSCSVLEMAYYECAADLKLRIQQFLPENIKDLPKIMRDSYLRSVRYVCDLEIDRFWDLTDECIKNAQHSVARVIVNRFLDRRPTMEDVNKKHNILSKKPTTKHLCELLVSIKAHMEFELEYTCTNKKTIEVFKELYGEAMKPCLFKLQEEAEGFF